MNALVLACWILWAAVWAVGWVAGAMRGPRTVRSTSGWSLWLGLAVYAMLRYLPYRPMVLLPWLAPVGAVLLIAGTAFTLWARWVLGGMWSSAPGVKAGHELRTTGPYALTRHPIYTGMLAMLLGTALIDGGVTLAVFAAVCVYMVFKMREEERLMAETFGEQYTAYRRRTPQVIPGLRPR